VEALAVIRERADQVCPARHVSERAEDTWILCHEDVPRLLTVAQVADDLIRQRADGLEDIFEDNLERLQAALDALGQVKPS
jgi:hypothetical protein